MTKLDFHHFQVRHFNNVFDQSWCHCIVGASSSLFTYCPFFSTSLLGSTVVSPYVGMAIKQNGGYNASISVQTLIFHLVVNSTRLKTVRSGRWCCPNYTMAPRLVENVVKVTNLEVVKIEFSSSSFSSFFLSSASLAP